jgi:4-hydroxy-tetrahydrodipicolinate synthase
MPHLAPAARHTERRLPPLGLTPPGVAADVNGQVQKWSWPYPNAQEARVAAPFTGVGVALATIFDDRGEVDAKATAGLAASLVEAGIKAIVVAGSTGEASALDGGERALLLDEVKAAVPADIPVLAGVGAPSARQAVVLTRTACEHGADGFLALSPPRVADPLPYYNALAAYLAAAEVTRPLLAYHFPAVSAPGIAADRLDALPVDGIKDSSGDPERMLVELEKAGDRAVYCGSAPLLAFAGPIGCTGAILALANAEPELCIAAFEGDASAQRRLTRAHLAAQRDFPHGLKALIAERFGTSVTARLN